MTLDEVRRFLRLLGGRGCLTPRECDVLTPLYGLDGCVPMNSREAALFLKREIESVKRIEREAVEKLAGRMTNRRE